MEKRENESWEDYSFRNGIYKIIYENDKIIDVILPEPDNIIWGNTEGRFSKIIKLLLEDDDNIIEHHETRNKLNVLKKYWTDKEKEFMEINLLRLKKRYNELEEIISKSYHNELQELLNIGHYIGLSNVHKIIKKDKNKRVELYLKFLKNKEIKEQIEDMESKIKELKMLIN